MKILMLGGTRFFGVHAVRALLGQGHHVTIATRGNVQDPFGETVTRVRMDRSDPVQVASALGGSRYDVICDNISYCSNDVKALLDAVSCDRYIQTSSASVYANLALNTSEKGFDPLCHTLEWCSRTDHPYDEIKRQGECALFQAYPALPGVAVRYPYVIGDDDYTGRLFFYVAHVANGIPMMMDNPDNRLGFIHSAEAGRFLAWCASQSFTGPVNASSAGTVTCAEIVSHVEARTGKKAVLDKEGEPCPYNGDDSFSLDTARAQGLGFSFSDTRDWIFQLLDRMTDSLCKA